jgi:hypothetical protein
MPVRTAGTPVATANEQIIITQLAVEAPEGSEDDVGEFYGLELLDWSMLTSLEMRIARYRVPRSRPVQSVLEQLRKDHRVVSAEVSVQYAHPSAPSKDDSEATVASAPAQASGRRTASTERATPPPRASGRDRVASVPTPPPRRVDPAGDILAGGL